MLFRPKGFLFSPDPGGGGGDPEKDADPGGGDKPEKSFSQKDVDALMGKTRKEAREAALGGFVKELGFESADVLKNTLADLKKLQEAQMSETEKQKLEAEKWQKKAAENEAIMKSATEKANERLMKAAVLTEAAKADYKLSPAALNDVWLFVDRSKLEMTEEGEVKGLADAVKAVVEARPYLQQNGTVKGPDPTPKPNGDKDLTDEQRRKQAAAVRTYW